MSNGHQSYDSFQEHVEFINGQERKQEKTVKIRNGAGTKTVRYLAPNGSVLAEKTMNLNSDEIDKILGKTFIPELFHPCIGHCMKKINGGRRGHGAIFFTKHKGRKSRRMTASLGKSRRMTASLGKSRRMSASLSKSRRHNAASARKSRRANY